VDDKLELREEELRVLWVFLRADRQDFNAFLDDVVPVLVVDALEHMTLEFRDEGDETLHTDDF